MLVMGYIKIKKNKIMGNILLDMLGMMSRKKVVIPKLDDFITIARSGPSQDVMKPSPKAQTELVTIEGLKELINDGGPFLPLAGGTMLGNIVLNTNLIQGLQIHTPATSNIGLGIDTLSAINTGDYNIGLGDSALLLNTEGDRNIGIGVSALMNNTEGNYNIGIGFSSLSGNHTTNNNTAVGYKSLAGNIASDISAFGSSALLNNTTGTFNNAFGSLALNKNETGDSNNAFGYEALRDNVSGIGNSAFGNQALNVTTANSNSGFGNDALLLNTTGRYNTAIGDDSLSSVTTGAGNTGIGQRTGSSISTYSDCIVIGKNVDIANNADSQLNIGNWIYGNVGAIGIGVTTPASKLDVAGGVKVADDTDVASAAKVGTIRYKDDASNSYTEICMRTGAATYAWHVLATYAY